MLSFTDESYTIEGIQYDAGAYSCSAVFKVEGAKSSSGYAIFLNLAYHESGPSARFVEHPSVLAAGKRPPVVNLRPRQLMVLMGTGYRVGVGDDGHPTLTPPTW
jgi:hypothetical protein